jgi:hypothetical protein
VAGDPKRSVRTHESGFGPNGEPLQALDARPSDLVAPDGAHGLDWSDSAAALDAFALIDLPFSQAQGDAIWGEGELSDDDPFSPVLAATPSTLHHLAVEERPLRDSLIAAIAHCKHTVRVCVCVS